MFVSLACYYFSLKLIVLLIVVLLIIFLKLDLAYLFEFINTSFMFVN